MTSWDTDFETTPSGWLNPSGCKANHVSAFEQPTSLVIYPAKNPINMVNHGKSKTINLPFGDG